MGQETADVVEVLDEYVAKAMSLGGGDFDNDKNFLTGRIQYGYNSLSDSSLVSPEYKFFITNAETKVKFNPNTLSITSYIMLLFATNYLPEVSDKTNGFYRRVHIILI